MVPLRAAMLFTPTISPAMFTSGPPELPGFTAASVWMKSKPGAATSSGAPLRLTMPKDTVCSSPKGWPSARTNSPTRSRFESPSSATGKPGRVDLHQGQVHAIVEADHAAGEAAAVGELDLDALGLFHHMRIGHEIAVLANDEARARGPALVGIRLARRGHARSGVRIRGAAHPHLHQRRLHPLGEAVHEVVEPLDVGRRAGARALREVGLAAGPRPGPKGRGRRAGRRRAGRAGHAGD